jgi:hypothetical protein
MPENNTVQTAFRQMEAERRRMLLARTTLQRRSFEARAEPRPDLLTLAEVKPAPQDWLWEPYLPAGMLAMLSGDPGSGTTYLALAIAAALTRKARVLYLSAENSPERVVRTRFDALGGNPQRFHLLRASVTGAGEETRYAPVSLSDLKLLNQALLQTSPRLLIVDPVQSYLDAAPTGPIQHPWSWLAGLCRLSEKHGCCTLLVRHLTKGRTGRAAARALGPLDLTGTVRSELLAGISSHDPQQRAMAHVKSNVGPLGPALSYSITTEGAFHWTGKSLLAVHSLVAPDIPPEEQGALGEAVAFLRQTLAERPLQAAAILSAAGKAGIAQVTLRRAKFLMGIESRHNGADGLWYWQLPGQDVTLSNLKNQEDSPIPATLLAGQGATGSSW